VLSFSVHSGVSFSSSCASSFFRGGVPARHGSHFCSAIAILVSLTEPKCIIFVSILIHGSTLFDSSKQVFPRYRRSLPDDFTRSVHLIPDVAHHCAAYPAFLEVVYYAGLILHLPVGKSLKT
jgi:hypothetical protein